MNVTLTPELEEFIENKISTGRYQSPTEVIAAGLKPLDEKEGKPSFMVSSIEELHQKLDDSLASLERGEYGTLTADELIASAREKKKALATCPSPTISE